MILRWKDISNIKKTFHPHSKYSMYLDILLESDVKMVNDMMQIVFVKSWYLNIWLIPVNLSNKTTKVD